MLRRSITAATLTLLAAGGCGDAPTPRGTDTPATGTSPASSLAPAAVAPVAATSATSAAGASAVAAPSASPAGSAAAGATPPDEAIDLAQHPRLVGDDGEPLPQTDDRPRADSPAFRRRMDLLWRAIVADDPSIATEAVFFPKVAYAQVKDIKKPEADWKSRLVRAFERNVHEYHRKLGDDPAAARLVGIEIDEARVKVMERGKEGNKLPYHRVTRSKIRFVDGAGKERTLELTSLIAWRGEWFVVHLHGFK